MNNTKLNDKSTETFCNLSRLKVNDYSEIETCVNLEKVFMTNSIIANWKNIGLYFSIYTGTLTDELIDFLNNIENAKSIASTKFSDAKVENKFNQELFDSIIFSEDISLESFKLLIKSINYSFDNFDFKELTEDKVISLAMSGVIRLNTGIYSYLKENHSYNHIDLLNEKYTINDHIEDYEIDETDFKQLLGKINSNTVLLKDLVQKKGDTFILNNQAIAISVSKKISTLDELNISLDVINYLIQNSVSSDIAIKYILKYQHKMNRVQLTQAFSKVSSTPYLYFSEEGKQFSISNNSQNTELLKILEDRKYITKPKIKGNNFSVYVKKWS